MKKEKTLLEHRRKQMDDSIDDILDAADTLRKCRDGEYSDLTDCVIRMETSVQRGVLLARIVNDLEDIEKYGPGGGRG